jgi:hypothetical protein
MPDAVGSRREIYRPRVYRYGSQEAFAVLLLHESISNNTVNVSRLLYHQYIDEGYCNRTGLMHLHVTITRSVECKKFVAYISLKTSNIGPCMQYMGVAHQ